MWYSGKPIPTSLITGFLGTGKTTAIRELLRHKPSAERWSVLVNEYGMVSIDDLLIDEQAPDVHVQEIAGGCFCCTTSGALELVLASLIRQTNPHRLLIEPSGAGHPAGVIDTLRSPRFSRAVDLRATICLVDPKDFENPRISRDQVFHDQVQMADVVAISWLDKRDPQQVQRCRQWIESLDPPRLLIAETSFGRLDRGWLDLDGTTVRPPQFPHTHIGQASALEEPQMAGNQQDTPVPLRLNHPASPGHPLRLENSENHMRACGWIFHRDDVFDRETLFDCLGAVTGILRMKGVFHCADDWWTINRRDQAVAAQRTAYRRDSRIEIITDQPELSWQSIESILLQNQIRPGGENQGISRL